MKDIKIIFSIASIRMFILIMVLMVLGSFATPQISKAQGSQGTFYALTWSPVPIDSNNLYFSFILDQTDMDYYGAAEVARRAKEFLDTLPEGCRSVRVNTLDSDFNRVMMEDVEKYIWWDNGAQNFREYIESFLHEYSQLGGTLDYFYVDFEISMSNFNIGTGENNIHKYRVIEADSRYITEIKPLLQEVGFVFDADPSPIGDLDSVCYYTSTSSAMKNNYLCWNRVMAYRVSKYLDYAVYEPARNYYPNIKTSNYGYSRSLAKHKIPDNYGHKVYLAGDALNYSETHSAPVLYRSLQQIKQRPPEDYFGVTYASTPFNNMLYVQNVIRNALIAGGEGQFQPWASNYIFENGEGGLGNTDYYMENILHAGLANPDSFLYWGPKLYPDDDPVTVAEQCEIFDNVLNELNEVAGYQDRKTLINNISSWNVKYLLSGMEVKGQNVWRITPDLSVAGMTIENFCVQQNPPVFRISGQEIAFPSGSSIYTPDNHYSQLGYWVISPAGTVPVQSHEFGYSFNASVHEDFENTNIGTDMNDMIEEEVEGKSTITLQKLQGVIEEPPVWIEDSTGQYSATLTVDQENETVYIFGNAGRKQNAKVTIKIFKPSGDLDFITQVTGDKDGNYSFLYKPESQNMGLYNIYIGAVGLPEPLHTTFKITGLTQLQIDGVAVTDFEENELQYMPDIGYIRITVSNNNQYSLKSARFIVALYNKNKQLKSIVTYQETMSPNAEEHITFKLETRNTEQGDYVKIFCLDNLNTIIPIYVSKCMEGYPAADVEKWNNIEQMAEIVYENGIDGNRVASIKADGTDFAKITYNLMENVRHFNQPWEKQVWEIKIKLPMVSISTAETWLFTYKADGTSQEGSPIKIFNKSIYIRDNNKNVSILRPGYELKVDRWYTIRRYMDFSEREINKSKEYVYDDRNNCIGCTDNWYTAGNISGFPIQTCTFSAKQYEAGMKVQLDDFKAYPYYGAD